jgi:hypothetical protein
VLHLSQLQQSQIISPSCRHQDAPLYTFGHGLTYTTFAYSDLTLSTHSNHSKHAPSSAASSDMLTISARDTLCVRATVRNTGGRAGAWPVLVFVADDSCIVPPAPPMVKGFRKVDLEAGESTSVAFEVRNAWRAHERAGTAGDTPHALGARRLVSTCTETSINTCNKMSDI